MAIYKSYQFDWSEVTAIAVDDTNGHYLWIAFKAVDGACLLKKVSAHDLSQTYYAISVPVTSINHLIVLGNYVYASVTDATYAIYSYYTSSPLSIYSTFTKTALSITEDIIGCCKSTTNVYFATTGDISAEEAKIVSINSTAAYVETIALAESGIFAQNVSSITIDALNNLWVIDSGDPARLYRVYYSSGAWHIAETILE
jgi:hypothetical protein